jgi:pimeloyl-ACP methyl ester carboxylesterase
MRFSTVQLPTGLQVHYAESGAADGVPVLFLHGWPDSWFSFSAVLPLMPQGLRCIAPDQRGFGDSDQPEGSYQIDDFASDAVALLEALSMESATIVGHSLGAYIARCMAILHPERVDRLVLIGSSVSTPVTVLQEIQEAVADLEDPVPIEFVREFQSGTAFAQVAETFMEGIVGESLKAPARVWRDVIGGLLTYDDSQQLARIAAPTLLVCGDHDAVFGREEQARLAATLPNAEVSVYRETGHCANWGRPAQLAADIASFIGAH